MLVPSIFSDNFFDDFFEFPFIDDRAEKNAERKLYGHHACAGQHSCVLHNLR